MKRRIIKAAGTALFLIGFVLMFGEAQTAGAQIACSLGAAALCLIGGEMISRTLEEDGE